MADSFGAEHYDTLEKAVAGHRAEVISFPNGVTITQGELDDMPSDSMLAFISNMFATAAPGDVE